MDPDPGAGSGPDYVILSASFGTLDSIGNWSWTPQDPEVIGVPQELVVTAQEADLCCCHDTLLVNVTVTEGGGTVEFTGGCSQTVTVGIGEVGEMLFDASGSCNGYTLEYSVVDDNGVAGSYGFVGNLLQFEPAVEDIGYHMWEVMASCYGGFDYCHVAFVCVPDDCCGHFTGGYTGNTNFDYDGSITLGDITMLVNHVFVSKKPLYCHPAGNVNGDPEGNVTLSDITRLVDRVYISKGPTALCQ